VILIESGNGIYLPAVAAFCHGFLASALLGSPRQMTPYLCLGVPMHIERKESEMSLQFDTPNPPNPSRLVESLRYLGYGNYEAVADLVDNSLDAHADRMCISIAQKAGDYVLSIADNGDGMDKPTLDEAMRLGSMTERNPSSDLGKFGMGLVTASSSIARRAHVITCQDGQYWSSAWDIDEVIDRNEFCKHLDAATHQEIDEFHGLAGDAQSGTVVILSKCDNLKNKTTTQFASLLRKHLGRVHRYFISAGTRMFVNGDAVMALDPLQLDDPDVEVFSDDKYPVEIRDGDARIQELVHVRIALIPRKNTAGERESGAMIRNQGFYIMRNQREIMHAQTLNLFTRHNNFNRMRGEIFFPGTLDKYVGIEFTKRDMELEQSLADQIEQYIKPQCSTIKRQENARTILTGGGEQQLFHEQAAKAITQKDKLLVKPKAVVERRRAFERNTHEKGAAAKGTGRKRLNLKLTQEVESQLNCRFLEARLGPGGQIFECDMAGRTVEVRWNIEHPFYGRFVADNASDGRIVTAVDFLVYSMAAAELGVVDDDEREVMLNAKTVISSNLRTLLS
jgi:hypothetical protein